MRFNENKATQSAAYFLNLRGGRMHYLKLIKLLYLADREALLRWGVPITTDRYVSMDHGPVVSNIYNLITDETAEKPHWATYISPPIGEYEVELIKQAPTSLLSIAEEKLMSEIFDKYGHMYRFRIVDDVCHRLPEWKGKQGTSIPISICEILRFEGEDDEEIHAIEREIEATDLDDERFLRYA